MLQRMALNPYDFSNLDSPLLGSVNSGGAQRTVVVVHAAASELDGLAVDPQPTLRIDLNLTYAK